MSTELDRAVAALQARADTGRLPSAAELRARGDHRRRVRVLGATLAVAAIVLSIAIGTGVLRTLAMPNPAVTPSGTPSLVVKPSPTVEPTPEATQSPYPESSPIHLPAGCSGDDPYVIPGTEPKVAGLALPGSMLLTAANWGRCWVMVDDVGGYLLRGPDQNPPPVVCSLAGTYAADEQRIAGRMRTFVGGVELGAYQTITRYEPGQAAPFMDEIRAAVRACATYTPEGESITEHAWIVETGFAGDESLMIYRGPSPTPPAEIYPSSYMAVVRVGDLVTVVEASSDLAGIPSLTKTLAQRAAAKL